MTRGQALQIIRERGDQTPHADIDKFCAFAGITRERFFAIAETFRNHDVWKRREDGSLHIPGFLFDDWRWS
jgi:hypothetical protein